MTIDYRAPPTISLLDIHYCITGNFCSIIIIFANFSKTNFSRFKFLL